MAALANGQDGKSRADWLVWELYALIGAAILSTALILLGNAAPTSLWLLAVLAAAIWQALLLPSAAAWFGALAVLLAWVLARQASGAWAQAEVLQIGLEAAGLAASLFLAARFRRHWEQQQQEMSELRGLRRALVEGEPGTGLLPREVAELRLAEEIDRARQFRRPLGLLLVQVQARPGHMGGDGEFSAALQAVTRQLASAALIHDIPFRVDRQRVALLLPERGWEKMYEDAEAIIEAIRHATFPDQEGRFRPVAHDAVVNFGLGTYRGQVSGSIDLMRAAEESLAISSDLADTGQAPLAAYALPATPIVESRLLASDEAE